jgi:hypothetical protein
MFASMAEKRRIMQMIESSIVLAEPLKNEVDKNGQFTIKLNSGIKLKATKKELILFCINIQKLLLDEN